MVVLSNVSGTGIINGVGTGSITPTATKVKADSQLVSRVDDENTSVSVTGTIPNPPYTPVTMTVGVKVTDAGQTKVTAQ